jgi:hypothetical protein
MKWGKTMKSSTLCSLSLMAAALLGAELYAATPVVVIKPSVVAIAAPLPLPLPLQVDYEFRKPAGDAAVRCFNLNTKRFDSLSASLDLTDAQQKLIQTAKIEIIAEALKLMLAQPIAQNNLDKSTGTSGTQTRELRQATKNLESYDAGNEFVQRLWTILTPDQIEQYLQTATMNIDVAPVSKK